MEFEWDEAKNRSNRHKHGIWFEEAQTVFDDPNGRLFVDDKTARNEDRFLLVGYSNASRLLVVVHCLRKAGSVVRLISARKATKQERAFYEERI